MQYPLEVDYDYEGARNIDFGFDVAPRLDYWSALLPPLDPKAALGVGGTPLVDISSMAPSSLRERRVYLKDESRNPTWSHKDRLNACTTSAALAVGASTIIVASSGNHGVSAAAHAARAGLKCIVFTMPEISPVFRDMLLGYGAYPVYVPAEGRWPLMRSLMEIGGVHPVSNLTPVHTGHPWGPEGYKTISFEIFAELGEEPGAVVVPTGYGEMLFGIHKGFRELRHLGKISRLPKLVAVEPAARGPLYHAIQSSVEATMVAAGPTRQSGTACTVNGFRGVVALRESNGIATLVTDEEAEHAQSLLARQGLWQELSASAAFAALSSIETADGPTVIIGCSSGMKEPAGKMAAREIDADLTSVRRYLKTEHGFEL
ncbi:hypothetical protein N183_32815 [Sinorhizobium sp. Sb3]|uniref:threonine synthase n=1 Tax=Sinorhizobium sp. Sb3 TaxID=1358417 RepID=UPI000729119B|nr:pyridoxal-phosphate dependent enzyme [Sinorhizobium sp. Sb3]KSV66841.1 hypothetical protein N183_32815 [Sinorhizobium sp. Sb3]